MNVSRRNRGFTLLEMMTTMGCVGIVATIAVPEFSRARCRAQQTEGRIVLKQIHKAEINYHIDNLKFTCNGALLRKFVDLPWVADPVPDVDDDDDIHFEMGTLFDHDTNSLDNLEFAYQAADNEQQAMLAGGGRFVGIYFSFNFANPIDCTATEYWAAAKRGILGNYRDMPDTMRVQYFGHNDGRNGIVRSVNNGCADL